MRLKMLIGCGVLAAGAVACTFPETRMEPASDYVMAMNPSVSGQPAYTAGPSYVLTTARDGSTFAVGCDGRLYAELPSAHQTC